MKMKEDDKELFLKVDGVDPVFKNYFSPYECTRMDGIEVRIGGERHLFSCDQYTVCNPDGVREDGRRQAMLLAIKLCDMSTIDKHGLFGASTVKDIFLKFPYKAITEKLDTWKKEKEKIRVRDEVEDKNNGMKIVVTVPPYMSSNSNYYFSGIRKDGKVYRDEMVNCYKKTGLHVDDLDSYLEV